MGLAVQRTRYCSLLSKSCQIYSFSVEALKFIRIDKKFCAHTVGGTHYLIPNENFLSLSIFYPHLLM
jgi:hypothetical protein